MGTARTRKGPSPEKSKHKFKTKEEAMTFLLGKKRSMDSREWIERICAHAELGYWMAQTFRWVHLHRTWLRSGDYLRKPPTLPMVTGGPPTSLLTSQMAPQVSFLDQGHEVLAAYHRLVQASQQLQASVLRFEEQHPWARKRTRLWQSEQRLFCAFAMLAAKEMGSKKISPQEMEALALIMGIRSPGEEFEQDPKSNEHRQDAWKKMMREVKHGEVLELLRQIASEHRSPEKDARTPPEQSEAKKGDKK